MTLDEFNALPVIMSFFPLTFESGIQKWTNFVVKCESCDHPVSTTLTRGHVDKQIQSNYRTISSTNYEITAYALCPTCNKLTTARYILHEDMTLSGIHNKTGQPTRWHMRKFTVWERFSDWLKSFKKKEHE